MENIYLQESNSVLINDELEMSEQYNCNIISAMRKLRHHIQNCKDSSVRAKCSTAVPHSTGTDHSTGIHQATSTSDYTAFFNPTNPPCSTGTPFSTGLNYNVSNYSDYSYPYSSLNLYPTLTTTVATVSYSMVGSKPIMSPSTTVYSPSSLINNDIPFTGSFNQMKLPQIPLPEYGRREGETLENFINNFESIVDKYALSEFEKFVLLSKQLKNEPAILIKSLQGSQQSYTQAKKFVM